MSNHRHAAVHLGDPLRRGRGAGLIVAAAALLTSGVLVALLLRSRSSQEPPPPKAEGPATTGSAATEPVSDFGMLSMDVGDVGPKVPAQSLRELAFADASAGLPTSGTWKGYPLLFDFTGDGQADLVASNREEDGYSAWTFTPQGRWELRNEGLPRGMSYGPCAAADMDGDGIPDLLVNDHQRSLRVFRNDGQMNWSELPAPTGRKFLFKDIALGDLDGNGLPDAVGIGHFNGGLCVYLNRGGGQLELAPESETILGKKKSFGRDVELADIDQDGVLDIVVAADKGVRAFLTHRGTPMSWEDASAGLPGPKFAGNAIYAVEVGRFLAQSDRPQIAVGLVPDPLQALDSRASIGVFAWNAEGRAWEAVDQGLVRSESHLDLAAGDFDRDGFLDLMAVSFQSRIVVYLGDGKGAFHPAGILPCRMLGRLALGDVDANGSLDVVVSSPGEDAPGSDAGLRVYLSADQAW